MHKQVLAGSRVHKLHVYNMGMVTITVKLLNLAKKNFFFIHHTTSNFIYNQYRIKLIMCNKFFYCHIFIKERLLYIRTFVRTFGPHVLNHYHNGQD